MLYQHPSTVFTIFFCFGDIKIWVCVLSTFYWLVHKIFKHVINRMYAEKVKNLNAVLMLYIFTFLATNSRLFVWKIHSCILPRIRNKSEFTEFISVILKRLLTPRTRPLFIGYMHFWVHQNCYLRHKRRPFLAMDGV